MANKPQIPIKKVHTDNGGDDGNDLLNCYFEEVDGDPKHFNFYEEDGTQIITKVDGIVSPVSKHVDFTFELDGLFWTVTNFHISEGNLDARGHWSASDKPPDGGEEDGTETGTFQAQGGKFDELKAKKALAS